MKELKEILITFAIFFAIAFAVFYLLKLLIRLTPAPPEPIEITFPLPSPPPIVLPNAGYPPEDYQLIGK